MNNFNFIENILLNDNNNTIIYSYMINMTQNQNIIPNNYYIHYILNIINI